MHIAAHGVFALLLLLDGLSQEMLFGLALKILRIIYLKHYLKY